MSTILLIIELFWEKFSKFAFVKTRMISNAVAWFEISDENICNIIRELRKTNNVSRLITEK